MDRVSPAATMRTRCRCARPVVSTPIIISPRRAASPAIKGLAEAPSRSIGVSLSMTKRMLIDTTHAEETRVVVLDGNRLEDYDVETAAKKQLKGNIYLAKIVRVEPSLQAAFVEYGGNRHGFLAFSEIHPDYYQIPVADRERLIALQEEEARAEEAREDAQEDAAEDAAEDVAEVAGEPVREAADEAHDRDIRDENGAGDDHASPEPPHDEPGQEAAALALRQDGIGGPSDAYPEPSDPGAADPDGHYQGPQAEPAPESVGGESDGGDDGRPAPQSARFLRQYKIQEVIRRRQILLIQVVKEERGSKGAALTTYISLAGRFCVLMPNSLRGGGVSRKITSAADRRRLKEITTELEIPRGMAMIIRTAGAQRPRPEIRRDCEYLLRLWDDIREQTMRAMAPALIYEEANLIKRAIRDVYTRDVEEIAVDGEQGWKAAREFMRNLMPANAQKVILWRDHGQPLFSYYQVEHHLDGMLQPTVQLRSGGYLVINQTEALVAIDVNSGRSTRERGIEETALRTNLEASDEVARQLRLRDLAGLIVIDFIDMEARRHNAMVERRLKEALKNDRARIQVGQISAFGLMEMSRQRLRPSIAESSFVACPQCAGTGFVRGTDSAALHVLRAIEEEGGKQRYAEIMVYAAGAVALYVLNQKRVWLAEIEQRHRMTVNFAVDESLIPPQVRIEKVRVQVAMPAAATMPVSEVAAATMPVSEVAAERRLPANGVITHGVPTPFESGASGIDEDDEAFEASKTAATLQDNAPAAASADSSDEEHKRRRRRRRRRGGRREDASQAAGSQDIDQSAMPLNADQPDIRHNDRFRPAANTASLRYDLPQAPEEQQLREPQTPFLTDDLDDAGASTGEVPMSEEQGDVPRKRGRRGGARGRKPREQGDIAARGDAQQSGPPAYSGPTPANPFAGSYDIFDMIEQDAEVAPAPAAAPDLQAEPVAAAPELPLADVTPEATPEAAPVAEVAPEAASDPAEAKPKRKRVASPRVKAAAPVKAKPAAKVPAVRMTKAKKAELAAAAATAAGEAPQLDIPPPPEPEPSAAEQPAQDGRPGNAVQPILIDSTDAPPARRTGWWKR
jgi:ribonuclease E